MTISVAAMFAVMCLATVPFALMVYLAFLLFSKDVRNQMKRQWRLHLLWVAFALGVTWLLVRVLVTMDMD